MKDSIFFALLVRVEKLVSHMCIFFHTFHARSACVPACDRLSAQRLCSASRFCCLEFFLCWTCLEIQALCSQESCFFTLTISSNFLLRFIRRMVKFNSFPLKIESDNSTRFCFCCQVIHNFNRTMWTVVSIQCSEIFIELFYLF